MEEGMGQALSQIDALLEASRRRRGRGFLCSMVFFIDAVDRPTCARARGSGHAVASAARSLMNGLALAPAGANVVMQLSRRAVGRGVAESRVVSGALTVRPMKRTRTTLGYIVAPCWAMTRCGPTFAAK